MPRLHLIRGFRLQFLHGPRLHLLLQSRVCVLQMPRQSLEQPLRRRVAHCLLFMDVLPHRLEINVGLCVKKNGKTPRDRFGMHHRANAAEIAMLTITDNIRLAKKKEFTAHAKN